MKIKQFLDIIAEQPAQQAGFGGAPGTKIAAAPAQAQTQTPPPTQAPAAKKPAVPPPPPEPPAPKLKKENAIFTDEQIKQIKKIVSQEVTKIIKAQVGAEL